MSAMLLVSIRLLALVSVLLAVAVASVSAQQLRLSGKVVDENGAPVAAAQLTLMASDSPTPLKTTADEAGRFMVPLVLPGTYQLRVEKVGFYAYVDTKFVVPESPISLEVTLHHEQEYEETVNVVYSIPAIDSKETSVQKTLTAEEILDLPSPSTHDFRSSLPMIPGIVKDNNGRIHLNGGAENQAFYTLDGFNITSPATGTMQNRLSVDAIRAIRVETSRYSAEYGMGSAGVMGLETSTGDDRFRYSATNFLPSPQLYSGLHISNWNPRFTVSGPIVKGRAWFYNALDLQYDMNIVRDLPPSQNESRSWFGGDLTRLQLSLTNKNLLSAAFLMNFENSDRFGLGPLDPISTTRDVRDRFYFISVKDEAYLSGGWVLQTGVALNRINTKVRPLGPGTYVYSPEGRSGNYFLSATGRSKRRQATVSVLSPSWKWHGRHSTKFGLDAEDIRYRQFARRHDLEFRRSDGTLSRTATFSGIPYYQEKNTELSGYVQDRWSPSEQIMIEAGGRFDWDQLLRHPMVSPRLGVSWSPWKGGDTKFSGGVGIFYDETSLAMLGRAMSQERKDTFFGPTGTTIVEGPILTRFVADPGTLKPPYSVNWSLGWEQKLPRSFYLHTNFIQKRSLHGWVFDPVTPTAASSSILELRDRRVTTYKYLEFTVNRTFAERYPWSLSYARSSNRSNATVDFSLDNPMYGPQGSGPVDWDVPNRLISSAIIPVPYFKKYSIAYFLEWHTGFPWGTVNSTEQLIGPPNSRRFPDYFSLNLHLERRFLFWRYQWAFRAGFNNLTGHLNPDTVNNNLDASDFGRFLNNAGRAFTGRIRLIGKR